MKIAFYKGLYHGKPIDRLIALATLSKYSHCEFVFSDGTCASSSMRDKGVRFKQIDLDPKKWDVYFLNDVSEEVENAIRYYFLIHQNDQYDYWGALGSWVGIKMGREYKKFCSEICGIVLGESDNLSPAGLYRTLKKKNRI